MKLTEARRRALAVLAHAERRGGASRGQIVRYSNTTSQSPLTVYHQVAGWLLQEGLVEWRDGIYSDLILTERGRELAEAEVAG